MSFYGHRLAAYGPYSGFGFVGDPIIGDIGFDERWSREDWSKNVWGGNAVPYTPLPSAIVDRAQQNWAKLKDAIDMNAPNAVQAKARMVKFSNDVATAISEADKITRSGYPYATVGSPFQMTRITYFRIINDAVTALANENVIDAQAAIEEAEIAAEAKRQADEAAASAAAAKQTARNDAVKAAAAKQQADAAATAARLQQTQAAIDDAKAAIEAANQAKAVAEASAQKHKELRELASQKSAMVSSKAGPWVLGGLAVLTAGAIVFARRGRGK